ncbi:Z1 domain-containing protein [Kordiimonas pumila]|uniref:Z1 domain-containing protein n=1 Tax=Kordiimonas pumila TaxID=2161677 RepID=A0ABV7D089_9PROT|nr:Z1 domain-containing protein [Kordiimonas pumila]
MTENNSLEAEKSLISALVQLLSTRSEIPTQEEVRNLATTLAPSVPFDGDVDPVVQEVLTRIDTRMGEGISLIDFEADHDEEWVNKRSDIKWTYSNAYAKYLESEKWNSRVIQKLSDVGDNILSLLQNPESEGAWDRKGLVIGHVQSGKTANYLGVIGKAADAGYKFIIVIAGIHNNLRKQTQERIDSGFVGRSSDPENRSSKGVGVLMGSSYPTPVTVTNIYKDFDKSIANQFGTKLTDFSKPFILVIKKNVHTLRALHNWLKDLNASGDGRIADVPMLMIDDEADNASINTNKEELDPTKTNTMIRDILGLFEKSCYVGYTATPFANVFINPEIYNELFPKDFIYCLDAPNTYFGPDKVFIDDESSGKILEVINDAEEYIRLTHKKDHEIFDLPPSLYEAINQFIIAKTIRNTRGQQNKHCSMMINVSRFVAVQEVVRDFVSQHIQAVEDAVRANYKMPEHISSVNTYMRELRQAYDTQYVGCGVSWQAIKDNLYSAFDNMKVLVANSKSQDSLDYSRYEKDGGGLTAIAIGGLSLSRGLTIEGLCVSYMYRNTRMYDTLMQMGRWFGYRLGYDDLCRVYLNEDSINWYAHIAEASEELRSQIKQMRRDRLSPEQFGLYVQKHPDRLLITAANKMRTGQRVTVEHNFSGRIVESHLLSSSSGVIAHNNSLFESSIENGFDEGADKLVPTEKGWLIPDVPTHRIENFISRYKVYSDQQELKIGALEFLRKISSKYLHSDVLLISKKSNANPAQPLSLGPQERNTAKLEDGFWKLAKGRLASRGDEKLGLSQGQKGAAELLAREEDPDKNVSDFHYRAVRGKPLLMLHVVRVGAKEGDGTDIPAFGISFPDGDYTVSVDVVANQVYINNMIGTDFDDPDDEEDYDD